MSDTAKAGRLSAVPETPKHTVRVPDELWNAALEKAQKRYEKLTTVIIRKLREYVEEDD